MNLFLNHSLLIAIATFVLAKVSADDNNVENTFMRPRSLAQNHKGRTVGLGGDSFERVLQESSGEPAKIVEYESKFAHQPKECTSMLDGLAYVGEHAFIEDSFDGNDIAATDELFDALKQKLHEELPGDKADEVFDKMDKQTVLTSLFPQINKPIDAAAPNDGGRKLSEEDDYEEDPLHPSWESEEEYDQYMAHFDYYIETFPFEDIKRMSDHIDELGTASVPPDMTADELHAHFLARGLSPVNHRRLQVHEDEDLRTFVEARGHRVLSSDCFSKAVGFVADTIALVISISGINQGVAKTAAKGLSKGIMKKIGKKVLRETLNQMLEFGKSKADEAFVELFEQAFEGRLDADDIIDAVTSSIAWYDVVLAVAEIGIYAACLVVSGGACFALKLAILAVNIALWYDTMVKTFDACKRPPPVPSGFLYSEASCVPKHNIAKNNNSLSGCARECERNNGCKGFEYRNNHGGNAGMSGKKCILSSSNDMAGCSGDYWNLDFYSRKSKCTTHLCKYVKETAGCVSGHNTEEHNVSQEKCAEKCDSKSWCKSFEYYNKKYDEEQGGSGTRKNRKCVLSDSANSRRCNGRKWSIDLFVKQ